MEHVYEQLIEEVKQIAIDTLSIGDLSPYELEERIEKILADVARGQYLSIDERVHLVSGVISSIRGLGVLDQLIADADISEIMINGPDQIFVERGGRVTKTGLQFDSTRRLEDIIQRIVGGAGREVNRASPIVDTRLPDGSRVNVVLPPVSLSGPVLTIRKFPEKPLNIDQLIAYGTVTQEAADLLKTLVRAKYNIFISGGTGSGKTTLLNVLSEFIPKTERIITIEDSAELKILGIENLVSLETRNANSSGAGLVSMRDLIRTSLRMRPERIVVGEVRGAEALDMLQAMNTGHDGSISTGHANTTLDMLARLETMVLTAGSGLTQGAVRRQIASALDIIVHISRMRDYSRRVTEISEVDLSKDGDFTLNTLYKVCQGILQKTGNNLKNTEKLRLYGTYEED